MTAPNACDGCSTDLPPLGGAFCNPCAIELGLLDDNDLDRLGEWLRPWGGAA